MPNSDELTETQKRKSSVSVLLVIGPLWCSTGVEVKLHATRGGGAAEQVKEETYKMNGETLFGWCNLILPMRARRPSPGGVTQHVMWKTQVKFEFTLVLISFLCCDDCCK